MSSSTPIFFLLSLAKTDLKKSQPISIPWSAFIVSDLGHIWKWTLDLEVIPGKEAETGKNVILLV